MELEEQKSISDTEENGNKTGKENGNL